MVRLNRQPVAKLRLREGLQVDDRIAIGQAAPEEDHCAHDAGQREPAHCLVGEPVLAGAFLQHIFQAAEEQRQAGQAGIVEALDQRIIRFVDIHEAPDQCDHGDAGHDVDQEQPVPGEQLGQVAAERRPDGGGQRGDQADDHGGAGHLVTRKDHVGRGEHRRDHRTAQEALQRAQHDHGFQIGRHGAADAGQGEAGRRDGEQHARRQQPRQITAERDHDHLGDQIAGLHPADLIGRGRQSRLNLGQRRRHDLDIQNRHEHAQHHGEVAEHATLRHDTFGRHRRRSHGGG